MPSFPQHLEPSGPVYTCPFSATALTTNPYDLWCVTSPSNSRVAIREIRLSQYSDAGDAQAELLSLSILTGSTSISSGGTVISPVNVKRFSGNVSAGSSVTGPSTTLASSTSATLVMADCWNVQAPYLYMPAWADRIVLGLSQRAVIRITAPNDALTVNGTLVLQELGQGLGA